MNPSAIYFTDAQQARLRRYARDRRVTQSAVIRAAIDRALDQLEPVADVPIDVLAHMRRPFAEAAPEQLSAHEGEPTAK
jgi:hypothetical protein